VVCTEVCVEAHGTVCILSLPGLSHRPRIEIWHAQRRAVILRSIWTSAAVKYSDRVVTIFEELLGDALGADLLEVTSPEHITPADDFGRSADAHE